MRRVNLLEKLLELYPDKPWNYKELSCNKNIKIDFIQQYLNMPWVWNKISQNKNIKIEDIEARPD